MTVGTKSLLFGAHQFLLHPIFVALGWWELYGFPLDPRLYVSFIVHDWGYWGREDMDGEDGLFHPLLGALIMGRLFGDRWYGFTARHSRSYAAKVMDMPISKLCWADKLAICYHPKWLYLWSTRLTGELQEYRKAAAKSWGQIGNETPEGLWYDRVAAFMRRQAHEWVKSQETITA